jgi:hypothetical protein
MSRLDYFISPPPLSVHSLLYLLLHRRHLFYFIDLRKMSVLSLNDFDNVEF